MLRVNVLSNTISTFVYTNEIANGNFKNTTTWIASGSSTTAQNNVLQVVGSGTTANPLVYQSKSASLLKKNDVWFQCATVRVTNSVCSNILIRVSDGVTSYDKFVFTPTINTWYNMNQTFKITTTTPTIFQPIVRQSYSTSAIANGKTMEIKEVYMINLTSLYGAGNEPSAEDCANIFKFVDGNTQPNFSKQIAT